MKIFADLRNLIRLERLYLPFINTLEDRDIAAQIGYHDVIRGEPLTLKLLYLLDIGSIATVQRRLARLVGKGVVMLTSPPINPITDGALPLYGTWIIWMPVMTCSSSISRCVMLPTPPEP